jgi:hypothetical protein
MPYKDPDYQKKWRAKNAEKLKSDKKLWYEKNKELSILRARQRYQEKKEHILEQTKQYKIIQRKKDPIFRIREAMRSLINGGYKKHSHKKNTKTQDLLGCTWDEYYKHIESLWEPWMNWNNFGQYKSDKIRRWNIDHITPLNSANGDLKKLIKLLHYTNCRPLCSQANLEKGAKLLY